MENNSKQLTDKNNDPYSQQNEELRQLHLQRMRRKQEKGQSSAGNPECTSHTLETKPTIKGLHQSETIISPLIADPIQNLTLNRLIYDIRKPRPQFHLHITNFFNINPFEPRSFVSNAAQSAMVSNFGFQTEMLQLLNNVGCPIYIACRRDDPQVNNSKPEQVPGLPNIKLIQIVKKTNYPYETPHVKLWLIKFKDFLRVVVGTANLHLEDWSMWTNALWYQDFKKKTPEQRVFSFSPKGVVISVEESLKKELEPVDKKQKRPVSADKPASIAPIFVKNPKDKPEPQKVKPIDLDQDFYQTLQLIMSSMFPKSLDVNKVIDINLQDYVFQNVKVLLVPSVPGSYIGPEIQRYGLGKVRRFCRTLPAETNPRILSANMSSLGAMDQKWLQHVYTAFNPSGKQFKPQLVKVIFPTKQYTKQEEGAQRSLAPLFYYAQKYYKNKALNQKVFAKYIENDDNFIYRNTPHLKTIILDDPNTPDEEKSITFYMGSHNFTKAAWGELTQDKSKLTIRNFELGVIFTGVQRSFLKKWLPFKYPAPLYQKEDVPFFRSSN